MLYRILIVLLPLIVLSCLATYGASAYFSDTAQNSGNSFGTAASWGIPTLLDDGFEGTPWDANWDGNGNTSHTRSSSQVHSGSWAVKAAKGEQGYLTTDDLDTSAANWILVSFWYYPDKLDTGDVLVQLYDGSTYDTWYDIANHPSFTNNQWCHFSEYIYDSQYFITNFRLRFDALGFQSFEEWFYLDDVYIEMLVVY